jgi:hypothetical protein
MAKYYLLFSRFGWALLIVSFITIPIIAYLVPNVFSMAGLDLNGRWPAAAKLVFQLTIGSWCATLVVSVGRTYNWVRAMLVEVGASKFGERKEEVKRIHALFVWILALMTALSGYIAVILQLGG